MADGIHVASGVAEAASPDAVEPLTAIQKPEIYIALCAAAGTNLSVIVDELSKQLNGVGYTVKEIVISDVFKNFSKYKDIASITNEDDRINRLMDAGNEIRSTMEDAGAASILAISEIINYRREKSGSFDQPVEGTAYVIKSLKTVEEYKLLANLYKDAFFMISAYEPKVARLKNLSARIARSKKVNVNDKSVLDSANSIIERDENESGHAYGQAVREVFQLADVFVSAHHKCGSQIKRIVNLVFGSPYITPSKDEHGMFHAYAASLNSADLARQVGAVIVNDDGEVISSGCNEVPKVGGGNIWEEDVPTPSDERRDFGLGYDTTAIMKREILTEVVQVIRGNGLRMTSQKLPTAN